MRFGLALGGGFARGLAHIGAIGVLEQNHIPVHCIAGVSAGAMVAAAYASGATPGAIAGEAMIFRDRGDVVLPIRRSCWYPGLFQPVRRGDRLLVDGAIGTEVPALLALLALLVRLLGATHAISLHLPIEGAAATPTNMFHVINRCFRILHSRTEITWRQHSGPGHRAGSPPS